MVIIQIQACKQIHSKTRQNDLKTRKQFYNEDSQYEIFRIVSKHFKMTQMLLPGTDGNLFIPKMWEKKLGLLSL